jgi:hypothetical protein
MNFSTELKGSYEVEGPACEIKRTGGLLKKTTPVDRYLRV